MTRSEAIQVRKLRNEITRLEKVRLDFERRGEAYKEWNEVNLKLQDGCRVEIQKIRAAAAERGRKIAARVYGENVPDPEHNTDPGCFGPPPADLDQETEQIEAIERELGR
jgi:hypothetical protein